MFKDKSKNVLCILLLIGLISTLCLLVNRSKAEIGEGNVSFAISYEDVQFLSGEAGIAPADWLKELKAAGLSYVVITDATEESAYYDGITGEYSLGRSGFSAKEKDAFLMPIFQGGQPAAIQSFSGDASVPLVLFENISRTGMIVPEGFDLKAQKNPLVKGFYMYDAYNETFEEGRASGESINIIYRAVLERGMRMVMITPFFHEGEPVCEASYYADMISGVSERIEARGLQLGDSFSIMDAPALNPALLSGASLLLVALIVAILSMLFSISEKVRWILLGSGAVLFAGATCLMPQWMQKLNALIGAVAFSCLFAVLLWREVRGNPLFQKVTSPYLRCMILLGALLSIGIIGGLYAGSMLGTEEYLLGLSVFFGVKFSQIMPILATFILLGVALFYKKETLKIKNLKWKLLLLGIGLAMVLALLILRSGDTSFSVAELELKMRNWLEEVLYVRPRTKEMLFAFPAIGIFAYACCKRNRIMQFFFGGIAGIGCVSVINTFCHIVTPIYISLIRTLLGGLIGLVIALILILLLSFIFKRNKCSE